MTARAAAIGRKNDENRGACREIAENDPQLRADGIPNSVAGLRAAAELRTKAAGNEREGRLEGEGGDRIRLMVQGRADIYVDIDEWLTDETCSKCGEIKRTRNSQVTSGDATSRGCQSCRKPMTRLQPAEPSALGRKKLACSRAAARARR